MTDRQPITTLRDGFWENTSVVQLPDNTRRVRKQAKPAAAERPWALAALRAEIDFLKNLPTHLAPHFPPVLDSWDGETPGYESPYYAGHTDLTALLLGDQLTQDDADTIQQQLITIVRHGLHQQQQDAPKLSSHVFQTLDDVTNQLAADPTFAPLVTEPNITINGAPVPGLARSLGVLATAPGLFTALDQPRTLLHGDLIPENILYRRGHPIILIDPVSVAAITAGHPLFDLVKYASYASGELFAIRNNAVAAGPGNDGTYHWKIDWSEPRTARFWRTDLVGRFHASFPDPDQDTLNLLDAYFSLAMAVNTTGTQQWARTLKATQLLGDLIA